jgi:hypothetical protein
MKTMTSSADSQPGVDFKTPHGTIASQVERQREGLKQLLAEPHTGRMTTENRQRLLENLVRHHWLAPLRGLAQHLSYRRNKSLKNRFVVGVFQRAKRLQQSTRPPCSSASPCAELLLPPPLSRPLSASNNGSQGVISSGNITPITQVENVLENSVFSLADIESSQLCDRPTPPSAYKLDLQRRIDATLNRISQSIGESSKRVSPSPSRLPLLCDTPTAPMAMTVAHVRLHTVFSPVRHFLDNNRMCTCGPVLHERPSGCNCSDAAVII